MGFKKLLIGEEMPDKNDPKYKERYEKDVEAGKKFAKTIKLDKGVAAIQNYASNNRNTFLVIIFVFVFVSVGLNIYRMTRAYKGFNSHGTAVERQERELPGRMKRIPELKDNHQLNIQEYQSMQNQL